MPSLESAVSSPLEAAALPRGPLFLLDGNNIAYRAFFALPDTIATSTGFPTNALYGFCAMMIKILAEERPEAVIVAWDSKEKTFRHAEFQEYKAQRKPMPDLLGEQWPYFAELAEAFGFVNVALPGFEADDILATLARQADVEGRDAVIVTGDRDALQLVTDRVHVMATARGITETKLYDPKGVVERYGIPPALVADFIGLKGDTSDNIPGVPGIGEKTAAELLCQFGSVEGVLEHVDEVKGPKRRELLKEHAEVALLSKKLALMDCEAPITVETATVAPHELDRIRLRELFLRFEFATLLDRLEEVLPADEVASAPDEAEVTAIPTDLLSLETAVDWAEPLGLAHDESESGAAILWLAQPGGAGGGGETLVRELRLTPEELPLLRTLLGRGRPACHDFKRARDLHELMERPGHDTFLAAYLLSPGRRSYDLPELVAEAGLPVPHSGQGPAAGAAAAVAVARLAAYQERELRRLGMWELFQTIELPLTRVLLSMEQVGIHLDCYLLGEITAKIQDQMEELESGIYELAGEQFNLGSPKQLGSILFEKLGLAPQRKTKTGVSTDAKTLESLRDQHPVVEHIVRHRELSKLLSTYLLALPAAVDQEERLHTTFHQAIAATGRLSSSDPNLQNIPVRTALGAQIRECFTAEGGHVLVVADYSQIELRLMAYLSQEPALLDAFRRGEDIHARTAAEVFDVDEADVTGTHRRYAKAVNFGIMYGISAFGLSQQLGVDRETAGEYIKRYFERLPRVRAFIDATVDDARRQGFVATVFGRRRPIPELHSSDFQTRSLGERLAVNSVLQGSAADIIKIAMIRCYERLRLEYPAARLVLQVHDELLVEALEEDAAGVRDVVREEMIGAYAMDPPLVVDVGVGPDWLAAK